VFEEGGKVTTLSPSVFESARPGGMVLLTSTTKKENEKTTTT
jgi:hypothetical protein